MRVPSGERTASSSPIAAERYCDAVICFTSALRTIRNAAPASSVPFAKCRLTKERTMKRRACGAAIACAVITAFAAPAALADNPHGTPPGQAAQAAPAPAQPAGNSGNVPPGQADKAAAAQPAAPPATPPATQPANNGSLPPGQAKKATPAPAASPSPHPVAHYQGCTASPGSDGKGVKPSNGTAHDTCATAGSANTKE